VPAAYVPLHPDPPALLSAHVMERCGLKYFVLQSDLLQTAFSNLMSVEVCAVWSAHNLTLILIQHSPIAAHVQDGVMAQKGVPNADLFTPAAVRVPARAFCPYLFRSLFHMTQDDGVFLASPLTF
ncbi:unnamed protein product, partial [Coregonus sp. 'balchen']